MGRNERIRTLILGAAGRDFHNFNVLFRDSAAHEVVGFTATQIPRIAGRRYPGELAGPLYPDGLPIWPESELGRILQEEKVELVIFSYSDVSHEHVMHRASEVAAHGTHFMILGAGPTMLRSRRPAVAICAVRTGCGKSQTARRVAEILRGEGLKVVVVRHPMPYGDLLRQRLERLASYEDLDRFDCTIEEREEYEPHMARGTVVYAGVDYAAILGAADREAQVLLWDGGNNDLPFVIPDLHITVVDPHRPGHELRYHPGEVNLRMAHVVVINKVNTARPEDVETVRRNIGAVNPGATIVEAASPVTVDRPELLSGQRVLIVEDGPTLTHGEMPYGAGVVAARAHGARELVDPRPWAVGSIAETFRNFPHIGPLLPAMGYGHEQIHELEETINRAACDVVLIATPVDLGRLLRIERPAVRARYELQELGHPSLADLLEPVIGRARRERIDA